MQFRSIFVKTKRRAKKVIHYSLLRITLENFSAGPFTKCNFFSITVISAVPLGSSPRRSRNTSRFSVTLDSPAGTTLKTGPTKVKDVMTLPGPFSISSPLSLGCSQQTCLANLSSISQRSGLTFTLFTNLTGANFVAHCYAVNSSQKSHICHLYLR